MTFRVGSLVYLAFSRDEQVMGFAFPEEERAALVAADLDELRELMLDAWRLVVPTRVARDHLGTSHTQ